MHHMELGNWRSSEAHPVVTGANTPLWGPVKGRIRRRGILFAAIETQIISCNRHLELLFRIYSLFS